MSMNRQALIDAFIERQRDNFHELIHNLTIYYNNIRSHFSVLSEKPNQRYLFLSILLSFILLTIISLIIFEHRRLLKYIQKSFQFLYSYNQSIFKRIRNKFLQKTTPSLLNLLLNSKSHIREKFSQEFLRSLNQELYKQKVKKKGFDIYSYLIIKYDLYFLICTPYCCIYLSLSKDN
jgi:hypothetical protein